jgi:uncharacterized protein (DUF697 family)
MSKVAPLTRSALRRIHAQDLVISYTALAAASMAIPVPLLDAAAELAIQLRMAKKLCELYEADFTAERARAAITGIVGGLSLGAVSAATLRYVSIAGYFAGTLPAAGLAGAYTYAIGIMLVDRLEEHGKFELPHLKKLVAE